MERREHYDPEDIESLLQTRAYDALLDEERAYVLRHLSGRDEYEAMRALLNDVRDDDRRRAPITADPQLRADLLGIFRSENRPQWRIWLNSVGAFIWPKETSDLWRPALAFASLALLIVAGVWVLRDGPSAAPLAELHTKKEAATEGAPAAAGEAMDASADEAETLTFQQPDEAAEPVEQQRSTALAEAEEPAIVMEAVAKEEADYAPPGDVEDVAFSQDESYTRAAAATSGSTAPAVAREEREAPASHVVTVQEMAANQSLANATGKVSASKNLDAVNRAATAISNSPEVMVLFAAGW
ncbi:MAG: hypothetical protein IPM12_12645 [Flavobacteriales bacterium]|nr:hypothetical protein [Flavobacteriales bacterium]